MFSELLFSWRKAAGHKYLRRKPYFDKKGRKRYRYTYKEHHGGGINKKEAMVEGAAFRLSHNGQAGHFHIESVSGNRLKIRHDESGGELELSKAEFQRLLHIEHGEALGRAAERAEATLNQAKETGSAKQVARAKAEAENLRKIAERGKAQLWDQFVLELTTQELRDEREILKEKADRWGKKLKGTKDKFLKKQFQIYISDADKKINKIDELLAKPAPEPEAKEPAPEPEAPAPGGLVDLHEEADRLLHEELKGLEWERDSEWRWETDSEGNRIYTKQAQDRFNEILKRLSDERDDTSPAAISKIRSEIEKLETKIAEMGEYNRKVREGEISSGGYSFEVVEERKATLREKRDWLVGALKEQIEQVSELDAADLVRERERVLKDLKRAEEAQKRQLRELLENQAVYDDKVQELELKMSEATDPREKAGYQFERDDNRRGLWGTMARIETIKDPLYRERHKRKRADQEALIKVETKAKPEPKAPKAKPEPKAKPKAKPEIELTRDQGKARRRFDENHERLRKLEAQIRDQKDFLSTDRAPAVRKKEEQRLKSLIEEKRSLEAENKKISISLTKPAPEPAPIVRSEDEQRNAREFQANAEEIKGLDAKIKEAEERIARRGVGATVKREARKEIKNLTAMRRYIVASNKRILAGEKRRSTGVRYGEELVPYVPVSWKEAQSPEAAAKALILSEFSGVSDDAERFRGYLDQATSGKISQDEALSVVFEELSKKIDMGELYDKISEVKGQEFAEQALAPYLDKKALVRVYAEVQPFIRTYADATISELKQQAKDLEKREAQYRDEDLPPEEKKMLLDHTRRLRLEVAVQLGEAGVRETKEERTPKTRSGRPSAQYQLPGGGRVEIRQDQDDNRIRLFFPGKPSDEQRARLKKRGFRWSPRAGAWQRQLTENAVIASGSVLRAMGAELVKEAP